MVYPCDIESSLLPSRIKLPNEFLFDPNALETFRVRYLGPHVWALQLRSGRMIIRLYASDHISLEHGVIES